MTVQIAAATTPQQAYTSALSALTNLWKEGVRGEVVLRTDSRILAGQYAGTLGCASAELAPLLSRLRKAGAAFTSLSIGYGAPEPWDADEAQRLVDGLIAVWAAAGDYQEATWGAVQEQVNAACEAGDMAGVRQLCEVAS